MSIIYMPHRGTFQEAQKEKKSFKTIEEVSKHVASEHNMAFEPEDVYIEPYGYDSRIPAETYIVCICKLGKTNFIDKHGCPQAVGFLYFDDNKNSLTPATTNDRM